MMTTIRILCLTCGEEFDVDESLAKDGKVYNADILSIPHKCKQILPPTTHKETDR